MLWCLFFPTNETCNNNIWADKNSYATTTRHDQQRCSVNACCDIVEDHLFEPYLLSDHLTGQLHPYHAQKIYGLP